MLLLKPIPCAVLALALAVGATARADDWAAAYDEDGKYFTEEGTPTFNVTEDGTVDWYTFSGFRRYHSECHVCHGPDGMGSTYAPALKDSVMQMEYYDFLGIVAGGIERGNSVMPQFGTNANVMCYLDDIYIYLRAVGADAIPRGRPAQRADKPASATEAEHACMG